MTNQQTQTYPTNNDDDEEENDFFQKNNIQKQKSVIHPDTQIKISDSQDDTLIEEDSKLRHYPRWGRKAPQYLNDYITNSEEDSDQALINIDYCYKATCNWPLSYKEALNSSKAHYWIKALNEEMESLKENDVFELTPLPEGKKTVASKWVYTIKKNPDGSEGYKATFAARGFNQTKGLDYPETFSLATNITSVRILMQMVVKYDLTVHQMDVTTAYLHASIDNEIFVEQPEGLEIKTNGDDRLVHRLNKSLYGLKQSGRN